MSKDERDLREDLQKALTLLRAVDDYGIRYHMGSEWSLELVQLLSAYPEANEENDDEEDHGF